MFYMMIPVIQPGSLFININELYKLIFRFNEGTDI